MSAILAIALLMLVPAGLAAVAVVERFMWRSIKRINERVDALATRSTVVIGKASEGGSFEEV